MVETCSWCYCCNCACPPSPPLEAALLAGAAATHLRLALQLEVFDAVLHLLDIGVFTGCKACTEVASANMRSASVGSALHVLALQTTTMHNVLCQCV